MMKLDIINAPQVKSRVVASQLEQEILSGKVAAGSRLPSMRSVAESFSTSLRIVQSAFTILEEKGLVESRQGSGTYVSHGNGHPDQAGGDIYFLVPHPAHITLYLESSLIERRIIYGATLAAQKCGRMIHTIPVSKNIQVLEPVDWPALRQIPQGANVFVNGFWFERIFPFLREIQAKVLLLDKQFQDIAYPEIYEEYVERGDWYRFVIDRTAAIEQAVQYLHSQGRRRIGVFKSYANAPEHPFRLGMIEGYQRCGLSFEEKLYCEMEPCFDKDIVEKEIIRFCKAAKFDALINCEGNLIHTVVRALQKTGAVLPDDIALMSLTDHPDYLKMEVPVTAFDFPWISLGGETVKYFSEKGRAASGKTVFQASIIERESTRKNAGAFVNHNFMPEIPVHEYTSPVDH